MKSSIARYATIAALVLLILAVRFYYYTGPIFSNTQDEGIYLSTFASRVIFDNPINFSVYRSINYSNVTDMYFNPAQIFQFYVGLEYPELLLMYAFGYSANLAIYYVILTSVIEGIFLFLIIEKIANRRAAIIGTALFAFMPLDVLFSTHVQPLVPAAMALTISVYFFIVAEDAAPKSRRRILFYILCGFFIGISYITNPVGLLLLPFLVLALLCSAVLKRKIRDRVVAISLLFLGFAVAYSIIGAFYFYQSGNFLLYPDVNRAIFLYEHQTQALNSVCIGSFCLVYTTGDPSFYINLLLNLQTNDNLVYSGVIFPVFIGMAVLCIYFRRGKKNTWQLFFPTMFLFYLLSLMFFPNQVSSSSGKLLVYLIDEQAYLAEILVLPIVVVTAIGIERLLRNKKRADKLAALTLFSIVLLSSILVLNWDIGIYRASMYTVHAFLQYAAENPNATFLGTFLFENNANLISGYKYKVDPLDNCNYAYLSGLPRGTDLITGGTISMDISSGVVQSYDSCVYANLTWYKLVYNVSNPYSAYGGAQGGPNLMIYSKV